MKQAVPTVHVVMVLVRMGERFVLVEEAKAKCRGKWSLPGGLVELGEGVEAAAVRETREEAGLEVRVTGLFGIQHVDYGEASEKEYREWIRHVVVAEVVGGRLKSVADEESLQAKAWTQAEVAALPLREPECLAWIGELAAGGGVLPVERCRFTRR